MEVVIDIECNSLHNPTKIWVIVCREVASGEYQIFREVTSDEQEKARFLDYSARVSRWIGHNFLGYDYPVLNKLLGRSDPDIYLKSVDTLILSKLVDYSRKSHSIEDYGLQFGIEKGKFNDFTKYSQEMENYCVRDVDICERIYRLYSRVLDDKGGYTSLRTEQEFQLLVNLLHDNGFCFNSSRARIHLRKVEEELKELDEKIKEAFPPSEVLIREFTPRPTKYGTISKTSVPRSLWGQINEYEVGHSYRHTRMESFNPASHKQIIKVLNGAGWRPLEKTATHIEAERVLNRLKYTRRDTSFFDLARKDDILNKLKQLKVTGWKINEANLSTLPHDSPPPARLLAKRILLESRRRTLTEWLGLVSEDGRIRGKFLGIGAWTHRMAHQQPNTANIPAEFNNDGTSKLLGKEMRSLWQAPRKRLLVGVDAEGIQLRIFAHYINDPEFIDALVKGKKTARTDPHSLNQRILGSVCKSRQNAKRFIYALLLGAGLEKLAAILDCSRDQAKEALDRLLQRYTGFAELKRTVIPRDAKRGWFEGLDGRRVRIPGNTEGERRHLCMSGYLQNGEAIIMKKAACLWHKQLKKEGLDFLFVNMVHDEWQTEVANDMKLAVAIAKTQAESLEIVGEELGLRCPLAGSYWNEDHKDYTIGVNWFSTH